MEKTEFFRALKSPGKGDATGFSASGILTESKPSEVGSIWKRKKNTIGRCGVASGAI